MDSIPAHWVIFYRPLATVPDLPLSRRSADCKSPDPSSCPRSDSSSVRAEIQIRALSLEDPHRNHWTGTLKATGRSMSRMPPGFVLRMRRSICSACSNFASPPRSVPPSTSSLSLAPVSRFWSLLRFVCSFESISFANAAASTLEERGRSSERISANISMLKTEMTHCHGGVPRDFTSGTNGQGVGRYMYNLWEHPSLTLDYS